MKSDYKSLVIFVTWHHGMEQIAKCFCFVWKKSIFLFVFSFFDVILFQYKASLSICNQLRLTFQHARFVFSDYISSLSLRFSVLFFMRRLHIACSGSVTDIGAEYGIGEASSNSVLIYCVPFRTNAFREGINPSLPLRYGLNTD